MDASTIITRKPENVKVLAGQFQQKTFLSSASEGLFLCEPLGCLYIKFLDFHLWRERCLYGDYYLSYSVISLSLLIRFIGGKNNWIRSQRTRGIILCELTLELPHLQSVQSMPCLCKDCSVVIQVMHEKKYFETKVFKCKGVLLLFLTLKSWWIFFLLD